MNLYEACLEKFGVITAVMILADFSGFMADFNRANEEELKELIAPLNKDKDTDQIKSFVLEETGVETFGISTIGQAMLTAYAAYANSYVAFKHVIETVSLHGDGLKVDSSGIHIGTVYTEKILYLDDEEVSEFVYNLIEYALLREETRKAHRSKG